MLVLAVKECSLVLSSDGCLFPDTNGFLFAANEGDGSSDSTFEKERGTLDERNGWVFLNGGTTAKGAEKANR